MTDLPSPESPSLLRRLAAMLYDTLLVIAVVFAMSALALAVMVQVTEGKQEQLEPYQAWLVISFSVFGFFSLFWVRNGQTLGMQAWRIKLVNFAGEPPSTGQSLLRCVGALLSFGCFGLGYLWCLVDRRHRYWHDYLSRTELILLPRESRRADS